MVEKFNVALRARAWIEIRHRARLRKWCAMSPSVRGRGLKLLSPVSRVITSGVALRARAWIEITGSTSSHLPSTSPSVRGRGLKFYFLFGSIRQLRVALRARAWIEISCFRRCCSISCVALRARAWIEIQVVNHKQWQQRASPSVRGRGLK